MSFTESLPWIEKYRPKSLDSIIGHDDKIITLRKMLNYDGLPHLLFYGPPGTGKTSTILALTRELYGENYKKFILNINASGDRGISTVRNNILSFLNIRSSKVRIVILDEADAMTREAQSALRVIIETYSNSARFCFICNNINDIIDGIQSRCARMRFSSPDMDSMVECLAEISLSEGIDITDEAVRTLVENKSDFRQALNDLQGIKPLYDREITGEDINRYLGKPDTDTVRGILTMILDSSFEQGFKHMINIYRDNCLNMNFLIGAMFVEVRKSERLEESSKHFIIKNISLIEDRIQNGCSVEIQLGGLVSVVKTAQRLDSYSLDKEMEKT